MNPSPRSGITIDFKVAYFIDQRFHTSYVFREPVVTVRFLKQNFKKNPMLTHSAKMILSDIFFKRNNQQIPLSGMIKSFKKFLNP